jgi:protein TonB
MFGDTLLESSSAPRKRKRWPMATAFTAEAIIGGLLVIVPLLSTGVIPVSARVPIYKPLAKITVERVERASSDRPGTSGQTTSVPTSTVVTMGGGTPRICLTCIPDLGPEPLFPSLPYTYAGNNELPRGLADGNGPTVRPSGPKRIVSQLDEGQLVNKVEPVYPHIAAISGIQGQVKLHAIIARDGRIQSLNVISGHPLLAHAALDAVEKWRYRPYVLNGERVEVETFITINFRKEMR